MYSFTVDYGFMLLSCYIIFIARGVELAMLQPHTKNPHPTFLTAPFLSIAHRDIFHQWLDNMNLGREELIERTGFAG